MKLQVGVKILLKNKEGRYLILCRSKEKYWDMAGGRIDKGASLLDNLKREVMEETGLILSNEPKLITAQDILKLDKHVVRLTYFGEAYGEVKLSDEHSEYRWLIMNELKKLEPMDSYFKELLNNGNFDIVVA